MLNEEHLPIDRRSGFGERVLNEQSSRARSVPMSASRGPSEPVTDLEKEEISPAARAALFARSLPEGHPILTIRDSAHALFDALEVFINTNTRPPADLGFRANHPETPAVDGILAECDKAIEVGTPIVTSAAIDQPSVLIQSGARELRTIAAKLRAFLIFGGYQDGVREDHLAGVVSECVNYQNLVTIVMNDFSSLASGLVVARE